MNLKNLSNKRYQFGLILFFTALAFLSGCHNFRSVLPQANLPNDQVQDDNPALIVPEGPPPRIDGVISEAEWDGALLGSFDDGSELFAMYNANTLYLGIRGKTEEMIAVNVFLNINDSISVLHSSAALGTAKYARENDSWTKTKDFDWSCRLTDESDQAIRERKDFLAAEGWVASNSRIGNPNEIEYQIMFMEENQRLAISFLRTSDPNLKIPWPVGLDDDCILPTPGGFPDQMNFNTARWELIASGFAVGN